MEFHMVRVLEGLIYFPLMLSQMGSFLVILVKLHWEGYFVQIVKLMEVILMADQKERFSESFRVPHWENQLVP